jgi:hypothetical protein
MIKFELTIEEANIILMALGKAPYEQVAQVITKLQTQAQSQLTPSEGSVKED